MYLVESPRRGDSNKYPKRMFSQRITWDCQCQNTRSADFLADRIDVLTNFAVITNAVIKRVHCTVDKINRIPVDTSVDNSSVKFQVFNSYIY